MIELEYTANRVDGELLVNTTEECDIVLENSGMVKVVYEGVVS